MIHTTPLYEQHVTLLTHCYDTHAEKFSSTRKKNRPEFGYIARQLLNHPQATTWWIDIVELWCGDGRLYDYLITHHPTLIKSYTGIDISSQLLDIAQTRHPEASRINTDMIRWLYENNAESYDSIICVASFQHLPDLASRSWLLQQVYRVLRYGWLFISIDRSWSRWMIRKYYHHVIDSLKAWITTFWRHERNTLTIPFYNNKKSQRVDRVYHFFTKRELRNLLVKYHFHLLDQRYSSQDDTFHNTLRKARNICTVAQKTVFLTK